MIRRCTPADEPAIFEIVNDAAEAYRGVIPADRWHEPYMAEDELRAEIEAGVEFWGLDEDGALVGVMGIQDVRDVTLIRHAYVRTERRGEGSARSCSTTCARSRRGPCSSAHGRTPSGPSASTRGTASAA